jgi:3-oxoacyl-[acyl-carrier-protein] synthase III
VAAAVTAGHYDADEAARTRMVEHARDTEGLSSLEHAARAARAALDAAPAYTSERLGVMYHAFVAPPGGPPAYNPAAKIHQLLGLPPTVIPFGVTNGCAVGLASIGEACLRLNGDPSGQPGAALITASEVWPPALVDPYRSSRGLILADGAGALVVSNELGFAAILATASRIDSELADATRGAESLAYDPDARVDLGARFDHFAANNIDAKTYRERRDALIRAVVDQLLDDAGYELDQIDVFALTHSGARNLDHGYFRLLPPARHKINTAAIGHRIGHVGSADWFIGLHTLRETDTLKGGQVVMMLGGAGGWQESAALLRVL